MSSQNNVYEMRSGSLEYLPVQVRGVKGGNIINPSTDVVKIALPVINVAPETGDWKTGSWDTIPQDDGSPDLYIAKILVGCGVTGGDVELDPGDYDILTRVTDSPEIPLMRAGLLRIT